MKFSSRTAALLGGELAAGTALLTVFRAVAYLTNFDIAIGYFRSSIISTLLYIVPVALSLVGIVLAIGRSPVPPKAESDASMSPEQKKQARRAEKEKARLEAERIKALKRAGVAIPPEPEPFLPAAPHHKRTSLILIADIICVLAFGAAACLDFLMAHSAGNSLYYIRAVVGALAALSFLFPISGPKLSPVARLLQLATVAWCIACVAMDYFDWDVAMNSPIKTYGQFALCFAALYVSGHARLSMTDLSLPRRNILAAPAAIFGLSCGISGLCAYHTGAFAPTALPTLLVATAIGAHALLSLVPLCQGEVAAYHIPSPRVLPSLPSEQPNVEQDNADQDSENHPVA
jgi:hypothetical protein